MDSTDTRRASAQGDNSFAYCRRKEDIFFASFLSAVGRSRGFTYLRPHTRPRAFCGQGEERGLAGCRGTANHQWALAQGFFVDPSPFSVREIAPGARTQCQGTPGRASFAPGSRFGEEGAA